MAANNRIISAGLVGSFIHLRQKNAIKHYLNMSIDHPNHIEIVIILAKWVDQSFRHFEPTHVEEKLQHWHKRETEYQSIHVLFMHFNELVSNHCD